MSACNSDDEGISGEWLAICDATHMQRVAQEAGCDMERGAETLLVRLVSQQVLLLAAGGWLRVLAFIDPPLYLVREWREALRRPQLRSHISVGHPQSRIARLQR